MIIRDRVYQEDEADAIDVFDLMVRRIHCIFSFMKNY